MLYYDCIFMTVDIYLEKARESLASAQSELDNRRYNCSANRSYYACFQVAVYALLQVGIRRSRSGKWRHEYVKGMFARLKRTRSLKSLRLTVCAASHR